MRRHKVFVQESILVFLFLVIAAAIIHLATMGNKLFASIPFINMWLDEGFIGRGIEGFQYYQMLFGAIFIAFICLTLLHLFLFTEISAGVKYLYMVLISSLLMYMFTHSHLFTTMTITESILDLGSVLTKDGIIEIGFYIGLTLQVFFFAYTGANGILLFFYPQRRSYAVISLISFIVISFGITFIQLLL